MGFFEQFGMRQSKSVHERLPSEQREQKHSSEEVLKRGRRLSEYVKKIEHAQLDFFAKHERKIILPVFGDTSMSKGIRAAVLALAGAGAAGWSFFKRGEYGFWGHSIAAAGTFFGMQLFSEKGMESLQYFARVPRAKIDAWRHNKGMQRHEDEISEQEKVSEYSLRGKMLALQLETQGLYADIARGVQEYKDEKERITEKAQLDIQPQPERELQYELLRFLRKRLHYVDQLIAQHEELLGTMRAYRDLSELHEEKRKWAPLGIASVAAILAGIHATAEIDMHSLQATGKKILHLFSSLFPTEAHGAPMFDTRTESSLAPALLAMMMGWYLKYRDIASGREKTSSVRDTLIQIDEGIQGIAKYREGLTRRLARLRKKLGLEVTGEIEQALHSALRPEEGISFEQWERSFDARINAQFSHMQSAPLPPFAAMPADERFVPTPDEIRTEPSEEEIPVSVPPAQTFQRRGTVETELRAIKPLQPDQIVHSRKQTVVRQVIADALRIAGKEFDIRTQKLVERMPLQDVLHSIIPSTFSAIAEDPSVTEEALDEIVRYFTDLNENMTMSVADFVFPQEDDVKSLRDVQSIISHLDKGKKIRQALEKRRIEEIKNILKESPNALRHFFLIRYHVVELGSDEEVTQSFFEEHVRQWMRTAAKHDRTSMRQFIDICSQQLLTIAVPAKHEKQQCLSNAIRILDSHDTENPFIDAATFAAGAQETLADMRQRALAPIADAFRELCAHPSFSKEMKVQDIALGEWSRRSSEKVGVGLDIKTRYVSGASFFEASYSDYPSPVIDHGIKKVDSHNIIGSLARERDAWIPEQQLNDVIRIIRPLTDNPTPKEFDDLFFDHDGIERIELLKFVGPLEGRKREAQAPERPIYFVRKGAETVAAAKVLGIPVVARVKEMRTPTFIDPIYPSTLSGDRHGTWNMLTNGKLLETDIAADFNIKNGEPAIVTIKQNVLSWLPWFSVGAIAQICLYYDALYPGALDNLQTLDRKPIMKNALFTPQTLRSFLRKSM